MKSAAPAGLIALALIAASPLHAQSPAEPAVPSIAIDGSVRGEITAANRMNYSDGTRSTLVAIDLQAGQAVSLQATGALCARMMVLLAGETIAGPSQPECEHGPSRGSRLVVKARETGRHLVAISGAHARSYGPFRLEAKSVRVRRANEPLKPGDEFTDFLDGAERTYRLDISETGYYVIDMRSGEIDSMLSLQGQGVSVRDDDGGSRMDARLRVPLEPGSYTLRATASDDEAMGAFQLSVAKVAMPGGVTLQNSGKLELGARRIHGMMAGGPREYLLQVDQPGRVVIEMESEDFDTMLELRGNGVSAQNDDGGRGTNSRLVASLQPGTYRVIARGLGDDCSGLFTLSADVSGPASGSMGSRI